MNLNRLNQVNSAATCKIITVIICFLLSPFVVNAVELPANMVIVGKIGSSETVTPKTNAQVLIVTASNSMEKGMGSVLDNSGSFFVELSLGSGDNGTAMTVRLKQDGFIYQLEDGNIPVEFTFSGGLFPNRITLSLTVGPLLADTNAYQ
jgi:hypothetical protein